jgi:Rod binding domain-containing protein
MAVPLILAAGVAAPALSAGVEVAASVADKLRATAQDFEAVFLNTVFQQMFTGTDGEGPMSGGPATGVWRSFLTDEYAKTFARAGGVGIADHVYRALIDLQAARP